MPHAADQQLANLFHDRRRDPAAPPAPTGATWPRMNFYVPDLAVREAIDGPWLEHFPDPADRPARHTQLNAGDTDITCDFVAYVDD